MKPSTEEKTHPKPASGGKPAAHAADDVLTAQSAEGVADPAARESESAHIEQLRAELDDAKDRALRTQAELDNYRKRMQREMDDALRYANINLMRDLLPVVDNLHRAAESAEQTPDIAGLLSGVRIVARQFEEVLARHHCKRIAAHGEPFDPNVHEAIAQQPSEQHPHGVVMLEATTGFQLHDRVVRPTQVIVSSGPTNG